MDHPQRTETESRDCPVIARQQTLPRPDRPTLYNLLIILVPLRGLEPPTPSLRIPSTAGQYVHKLNMVGNSLARVEGTAKPRPKRAFGLDSLLP